MGKKRKHAQVSEGKEAESVQQEVAPTRPKRTLLGWKDSQHAESNDDKNGDEKSHFRNKEKVLVLCSRRIVYRYRHLMMDVVNLLPHCKKDNKVQTKDYKGAALNELVELRNCTSCLFFECRKRQDLYLWMAKCPNGPSAKFLVNAVHTMGELKLTGNHLKGSRPLLSFSAEFDDLPHYQLLKEIIVQIFCTPKDHRKAKPFFDHVFVFSIADNHIWFRNYQISVPHHGTEKIDRGGLDKMTLVEVGPRFCLNTIKIFGGSFSGQILFENPYYISPNEIRRAEKRKKAGKYAQKVKAKQKRRKHLRENPLEPDEFDDLWHD